ncbi:hypothetical protein [Bosea thiooxidans]|uniref:hypothetical protein n=1 Tax=Bosea thiooxidans TaxID=53254 RepID=UPI00111779C1|nr:hypothetical protein [Bosea thiooxidans]
MSRTVIPGHRAAMSPESMTTAFPSWSALCRPSTSSSIEGGVQGVDARHKGEPDGVCNPVALMGSGLAPAARPGMTAELR